MTYYDSNNIELLLHFWCLLTDFRLQHSPSFWFRLWANWWESLGAVQALDYAWEPRPGPPLDHNANPEPASFPRSHKPSADSSWATLLSPESIHAWVMNLFKASHSWAWGYPSCFCSCSSGREVTHITHCYLTQLNGSFITYLFTDTWIKLWLIMSSLPLEFLKGIEMEDNC